MATINPTQFPVFQELAAILASIDKFPNVYDDSDLTRCRGLNKGSSNRCKNNGCSEEERSKIRILLSEFRDITEIPETADFYEKMRTYITFTHCKRQHGKPARKAFSEWEKQRIANTSETTPITPILPLFPSPTTDDIFQDALSEICDTMSQISILGGPLYSEPVSDCDSEETISEYVQSSIDDTTTAVAAQKIFVMPDNHTKGRKDVRIPGIGIRGPLRTGSERNHAPVFDVIGSHPTDFMMQEGVVYILEHISIPDMFKIGFTTKTAAGRLKQPGNCYRIGTNIQHETKNGVFRGAPFAEKIIKKILRHQNIPIVDCEKCHKRHTEWFEAPRETVFKTVEGIEDFIQLPAYAKEGGVWKLSPEGHKVYKSMCNFDLEKLQRGTKVIKEGRRETHASLNAITETTPTTSQGANESPISDDLAEYKIPGAYQDVFDEVDEGYVTSSPGKPKKSERDSLGSLLGRGVLWLQDWRSRESTPEAENEVAPKTLEGL